MLSLNFGNWEIFKLLILSLRDIENTAKTIPIVKTDSRETNEGSSSNQPPLGRKKSLIEKQVHKLIIFEVTHYLICKQLES